MSSGTPWSVKGIDPKAREVAKDLARRSGMTLGEWLNRMILEDEGPEEVTSETYFTERAVDDAPAARPEAFLDQPPRETFYEAPLRHDAPRAETPRPMAPLRAPEPAPRYEAPEHPADEIGRVTLALDRLTDRIEHSEGRAGLAISAVEHSVRDALSRIEIAERENVAVAARFEGAVDEARTEQARLAERVRRVESEAAGPRSAEALRALEQALGKVANHLYEGEARTRETLGALRERVDEVRAHGGGADPTALIEEVVSRVGDRLADAESRTAAAMEGLKDAFSTVDGRLRAVEGGASPALDRRLEQLAANLSSRVDAARGEIAQKLQVSAEGRFDRMERKLAEMSDHVRLAEQRSAQAIEKMGREVLTVADNLNRRVQSTEHRSADAIEQVGGEVARIAQAMESKLGRTDSVHAEALERLGAEIGRITEKLSERIANAERRSAQAIDDVGEQVARVTERMNQRSERASDDLVERIRQSEERTARMLEEAREKIDARLGESHRRLSEQVAAAPIVRAPAVVPELLSPFGPDPFPSFGPAEVAADPLARQAFAPPETGPDAPDGFPGQPFSGDPERPAFDAEDFEAADGFAPIGEHEEEVALEEAYEPPVSSNTVVAPPEPGRPLSTREVIEQARAAARASTPNDPKGRKTKEPKEKKAKPEKVAKEPGTSLFAGFGARPKRRAGSSLQTALLVVGGAACLSLATASFMLMDGKPGGAPPKRVADALAAMNAGQSEEIMGAEADTTPFGDGPRVAIALTPQPIMPGAPPAADLAQRFATAASAVETKQAGGLDQLKAVANQGHAPAQFYLAKLYESGSGGVKKDLVEARRWTERAAEGGDPKAMHNLGISYISGSGGPKNSTTAAQWFRRAADLGLVDSQYNLAALYEQGLGVSQNAAESYKWYLVAARTGDGEARSSAQRVAAGLSTDARTVAERAAAGFRASTPNPSVAPATALAAAPASPTVVTAQRALSRLGYYQGPTDGSASGALKLAVAAYQRDQGMQATGQLDPSTVSKLSVFTR
ncbi:peptidoglycan-binding protein [Phenylobacterium sp.]|uniref:peptidoglycan-binding protein n=1 Tax=Phenylobacterium sp. TaxID=1871053 RepID=UPI0038F6779C